MGFSLFFAILTSQNGLKPALRAVAENSGPEFATIATIVKVGIPVILLAIVPAGTCLANAA